MFSFVRCWIIYKGSGNGLYIMTPNIGDWFTCLNAWWYWYGIFVTTFYWHVMSSFVTRWLNDDMQCDLDNQSLTLHEIWIWFLECLFVHTPENPCFDVRPCKIPIFPWFITGVSIAHLLEPFLIPNHVHDHQHANDWLVRDFKIIYSIFHWMSWWLLVFPPEQEVRILYHQNTDNLYHKNAATWAWWAWITSVYLRVGKDNRSSRMQ